MKDVDPYGPYRVKSCGKYYKQVFVDGKLIGTIALQTTGFWEAYDLDNQRIPGVRARKSWVDVSIDWQQRLNHKNGTPPTGL
jgi:hypothetical protein